MRWTLIILLLARPAVATDEAIDYLGLAALMIRDGHPERAAALLEEVDPKTEELELARFYTLRGLARLQTRQPERAVGDLRAAQETGQSDPVVFVYLAQAHFEREAYADALAAISGARAAGTTRVALVELEAECHWRLGDRERAWSLLAEIPDEPRLHRRRVFYAIELGLFATAAELGESALAEGGDAADAIAIGRALAESGRNQRALRFLQAAALRHPGREVAIELARTYVAADRLGEAASVLERFAPIDADLALEAADLYRRVGQTRRSLYLNTFVADPAAKLRQRLALLLDLGAFGEIAAMERALAHARLLDDQSVRYALAYAAFEVSDFETSERHLGRLTEPALFAKAMELRRAMQDCAAEPWQCVGP